LTLLRYEVDSPEESLERYRQICESAAQRLGPEFIQANRGRFGEIAETRPYLRARLCLATSLLQEGHTEEAIEHMREMLDLDEEDSHGIRFILLGTFLMTRQLEDAAALFRRFPKETGDTFLWGRVLERFLRGDVTGAGKALAKARRQSDELEPYFTGDVYLDDPDADDELDDDRVIYELGPAWEAHPDAVAWLRSKAPCQ
jgi:tetratricopeptide (TPR) repeat protein